MEKRVILAVVLSSMVIMFWSMFIEKKAVPTVAGNVPAQTVLPPSEQDQHPASVSLAPAVKPAPSTRIIYHQPDVDFTFQEETASIESATFKKYKNYEFTLTDAFLLKGSRLVFKKEKQIPREISFTAKDGGMEIKKRFIFAKPNYGMDLEIEITNLSSSPIAFSAPFLLGTAKNTGPAGQFLDVAVSAQGKITHARPDKDRLLKGVDFSAFREQYFVNIVQPQTDNNTVAISKINVQSGEISILFQPVIVQSGEKRSLICKAYIGPQDWSLIQPVDPDWVGIINYGFFDVISQGLIKLLRLFYWMVHNWGVAILLLSVAIYALLFPLTIKQMRAMKDMQMLQPKIEQLKAKYKDNPQKLQRETLELYKEHKVNPLGGCLPLLLQMPVFFALYQALTRSIVLKGARFLWIDDLSLPDKAITLKSALPIIGTQINILPILMAILMVVQQKVSTPKAVNSEYAQQQKMMTIVMPVLFGFIFYTMPSGLVLYWLVNSAMSATFQARIMKAAK
ncbi:MAG: membrane protein insertase YidC [Candidatus Omnitrophica bacterium]|jgi:YidC/Oxa1 family membrane protein insertase|nr:membrane protein insertase YidC [Candidatus Omnitrophota bacterium]